MQRPNVLLIHTDQQAHWTLGAHGGTSVATPHLDRLAAGGTVLDACYTVAAVCTPSRGCLMTGRYPHQHGAYSNNMPLDADAVTWAHRLQGDGYRTGYIGKWHLDGSLRPGFVHPARGFGFGDTRCMFNRGHWKRMWDRPRIGEPGVGPEIGDAEQYTTDWLTTRAIDFIDGASTSPRDEEHHGDSEPFALMLSIPDPHTPFSVREPYASMFDPEDMPIPESWGDPHVPSWADQHEATWKGDDTQNRRQLQRWRAAYLGMVACIDDNVGRLLDHLDARGLSDRTLIIFTSDHGEYLGEHSLMGKNLMYRAAYHVPCIMRLPGVIPPHTRIRQMVTQNDFAPTLCSLCGVQPPAENVGRDMTPLLTQQPDPAVRWRDVVHQHHPSHTLAGLLTPRHHLILHRGGAHRLFDLDADPHEMHNLLADPAQQDVVMHLADRILAHHEDTASPAAAWLRDAVPRLVSR